MQIVGCICGGLEVPFFLALGWVITWVTCKCSCGCHKK